MRPVKISALSCALFLLLLQATTLFANTFTLLHGFGASADGQQPYGGVTLCGSTLYGTANHGDNGSGYDFGVIYSMGTNGSNYTILYSFSGPDGQNPSTVPVVCNGWIYGTAQKGGPNLDGLIYAISTNGSNFTVLHAFDDGIGGKFPIGDLLLAGDTLFGTTFTGGTNSAGTVFSIKTNGANFTVIHSFTNSSDGLNPVSGRLTLAGSTLYGTTGAGGSNGLGVIYSVCTNGTQFNVLHKGSQADGAFPVGNLVLSSNILYGAMGLGGSNGVGVIFAIGLDGGNYRVLHAFKAGVDGVNPACTLTLCSNVLYGTTESGGTSASGSVFSINTDGTAFQVQYNFSAWSGPGNTNADGIHPLGTLVENGSNLFGIAYLGGPSGGGTVYELTLQAPTNTPPTNNHPAFFAGDISLGGDWYYLQFPGGNLFGIYNYTWFPWVYHQDLGFLYFFDANDGHGNCYFYDFTSGHFWFTGPNSFPSLYDFNLNTWIWYYPDTAHPGRYTSNPRSFYNFTTQQIFTQ